MYRDKTVHLLVFDGFADYSLGPVLRRLREEAQLRVVTFGFDGRPVMAASGLRTLPDMASEFVDLPSARLCLLPDGDLYADPVRLEPFDATTACLTDMLQSFDEAGVPIAAIGNAVTAVARAGLLDGVNHTGPDRRFLNRQAEDYAGSAFYIDATAISENNIITAHADAIDEFADEILATLVLAGVLSRYPYASHSGCNAA